MKRSCLRKEVGLRHLGRRSVGLGKHHLIVLDLDADHVARGELAAQGLLGERVLDHGLDGPLKRPSAVDRIEAHPATVGISSPLPSNSRPESVAPVDVVLFSVNLWAIE